MKHSLITISDWWFASTAVPLIAATFGPLANVASIAALVTPWRMNLPLEEDGTQTSQLEGLHINDPKWYVKLSDPSDEVDC